MTINERGRARAAFTLSELLVVMGIIALLVGMMVPAAGKVRLQAMRAECLSQMRSLAQAHTMYMSDNRNRFVPANLPHESSGDPRRSWVTLLPENYLSGIDALRSPLDQSPFWSVKDGGSWDGLTLSEALEELGSNADAELDNDQISRWSSYGLNNLLAFDQGVVANPDAPGEMLAWTRLSQVRNPANTVHFLTMTEGIKEHGGLPSFARSDHVHVESWSKGPGKQQPYLAAAQHMQLNAHGGRPRTWEGRAGYGFLDGSVASLKFSDVYRSETENRFNPLWSYRLGTFND